MRATTVDAGSETTAAQQHGTTQQGSTIRHRRAGGGAAWLSGAGDPNGGWVEAHPFRLYLRHLMLASGLSWRTIAVVAGVSPAAVRSLLFGRDGRTLRRISPETGRQLLVLTPAGLARARSQSVPSGPLAGELRRALARGWTLDEIADESGLGVDDLEALARRELRCTAVVAAQLRGGLVALADDWAQLPETGQEAA